MLYGCPLTVIVALRKRGVVFAVILKFTLPVPEPVPEVIVTNALEVVADHEHKVGESTSKLNDPPAAGRPVLETGRV